MSDASPQDHGDGPHMRETEEHRVPRQVENLASDNSELGLEERLRTAKLTPAQRQIARYILQNEGVFVFLSAAELAQHVGVSQPSVTRLAKRLGYQGYSDLIGEVRAGIRSGSDADDGASNRFQKAVDAQIDDLIALRENLANPGWLEEAAERIRNASNIVVVGLRISAALAADFSYRLRQLRADVTLITQGDSSALDRLVLEGIREAPLTIIFAMPRYPTELVRIIDTARAHNHAILVITDSPVSGLEADGVDVLWVPMSWAPTFGSHAAPIAMSALLADEIAAGDAATRMRLIAIEELAEKEGHYLDF